jgi:hypothetical protein
MDMRYTDYRRPAAAVKSDFFANFSNYMKPFMTSPLVQIDGQHFNLGTFDAVGLTASSRGSPSHSLNSARQHWASFFRASLAAGRLL